jgi:DNA-binding FadR family transcriptional regulator
MTGTSINVRKGSRRPPLADEVVADLAAGIIAGQVAPGHLLPTEAQLSERFGVSRTVVREAMLRLQRSGLIRIQQGIGTVVLSPAHWRELDPEVIQVRASRGLIGDLIPDLLAVRRIVEVEVAALAAQHRSETDLERAAACIARMEETRDAPVEQTAADIAFHELLVEAAGNRLMREIMRPIHELRRIGSIMTTSHDPAVIESSIAGHREIVEAVRRRDSDAARDAMARHIGRFEQDLHDLSMAGEGTPPGAG